MQSTLHTESFLNNGKLSYTENYFNLDNQQRSKTITSENAFSSPKGLPYFSDMVYNKLMEEDNANNEEIEMHIDEEMQNKVLSSINKVVSG